MRLSRTAIVPFPADAVFERARDELHVLADLLIDVESIEPLTRRSDKHGVERVDRWRTRKLGVSRRALPTTQVAWVATSWWDGSRRRVKWTIDVTEPARAATSRGELALRSLSACETELSLSIDIIFDKRSVTRFLSFAWRPLLERYAGQLLDRNIRSLLRGGWGEPARQRSA